jgi:hypothetical protein
VMLEKQPASFHHKLAKRLHWLTNGGGPVVAAADAKIAPELF